MREEVINCKNQALAQIMGAKDASELEDIRIAYLGKSDQGREHSQKHFFCPLLCYRRDKIPLQQSQIFS